MTTSHRELTTETRSPEETERLGAALGRVARAGDVLALFGGLGVGKTCLVRGLARGLAIDRPVASPTFVLINQHRGRLWLYHVDLYRIGHPEETVEIGIEELLPSADGVTAIEWAERIEPWLPDGTIRVGIEAPTPVFRRFRFLVDEAAADRVGAAIGAAS